MNPYFSGIQNTPSPGDVASAPPPPSLHWAIVLVLEIVTLGLFVFVWAFVQASFARKVDNQSKALLYVSIALALWVLQVVLLTIASDSPLPRVIGLATAIVLLIGLYSVRDAIELYYARIQGSRGSLNGILVFFLGPVYLQYHLYNLAKVYRAARAANAMGAAG